MALRRFLTVRALSASVWSAKVAPTLLSDINLSPRGACHSSPPFVFAGDGRCGALVMGRRGISLSPGSSEEKIHGGTAAESNPTTVAEASSTPGPTDAPPPGRPAESDKTVNQKEQSPSNNRSEPKKEDGRSADRVVLDQVAQSVHLMSVEGYEWIDFVARAEAVDAILHDGGFVMATRKMLHKHGIAADVVSRVARDVWLPVTHMSGDGDSIAVVTRVPYSRGDRVSADVLWADSQLSGGRKKESIGHNGDVEDTAEGSGGEEGETGGLDMTILGLTVRLNIFVHRPSRKIITVHRYPLKFIVDLQKDWHHRSRFETMQVLLYRLVRGSVKAFEDREAEYTRRLDWLESCLFREEVATELAIDGADSVDPASVRRSSNESRLLRRWWHRFFEAMVGVLSPKRERSDGAKKRSASPAMRQERDRQNLTRSMWWDVRTSTKPHERVNKKGSGAFHNSHQMIMGQLQAIHRQASATVRVLREVEGAYRSACLMLRTLPAPPVDTPETLSEEAKALRQKMVDACERESALVQDRARTLRGQIHAAVFLWEGLREQSQSLLSLQVSVAVSRLEELLRFLTVFTTIFIPLELVTSIFGMNFGSMHQFGGQEGSQWLAIVLMIATAVCTQRWIRKTTSAVRGASR